MLKVTNTLSKKLEPFKPRKGKTVQMYVCGPTVYGPGHIGHARTYIAFDVIRRYLEFAGYKVKKVVNLTDVHDDMIENARKEGLTIFQLAEKYIPVFFKDMKELEIKGADVNPRVTENIVEIIDCINVLLKKGFAYETDDGVYYNIRKFKNYGKLSKTKLKKAKTGTRVETDKYDKAHPFDFALWKKAKPESLLEKASGKRAAPQQEPFWESPFGNGRPGWHIECSVMSRKHLGEKIDIHGGAVDLIFPHHENEIAQSEAAFGKSPFVKYWLHTGFLNVGGQKMSKSLGNFITIPELLQKYDPKVFRFFIASVHYRSRINFDEKAMEKAKNSLEKLNNTIANLHDAKGGADDKDLTKLIANSRKKFSDSMDKDFNTPLAIAGIFEVVRKINSLIASKKIGRKNAEQILQFLKEIDSVFNFMTFEKATEQLSAEIEKMIAERERLRREQRFAEADAIRAKLLEMGIQLDDTPEGVKWRRIK